MVVLLRMPSLDRAGPKNGEPYGVWQFKRTATMYCCMQWVIALSFLGNAASPMCGTPRIAGRAG